MNHDASRATRRDQIEAFWRWWGDSGAQQVTAALERGQASDLAAVVGPMVDRIDPGLAWEITPGRQARYGLVVGAGGLAALRPTAERWYRAAPPASSLWEFHPSRPADRSAETLEVDLAGRRLSLRDVRVVTTTDHELGRVHVGLHHPAFAELPGRPPQELTFLALDRLLGEDDVERWIGDVEILVQPPSGGAPLRSIALAVDDLRRVAGEPTREEYGGDGPDGTRATLSILRPRRPIDHPLLDEHHFLTVAYDPSPDGLPTDAAESTLAELEADLLDAAEGRVLVVAVETGGARRAWHVYGDSWDHDLRAVIERWADDHHATHTAALDPGWQAFAQHP